MSYDVNRFDDEKLTFQKRLEPGKIPEGQVPAMEMSDKTLNYINGQSFLNTFGIEIGEDRKVPVRDGIPLIFVLQKDENGIDRIKSLDDVGIKHGTREFWQKVQEGNVFAYPAGSEHPVQVQATIKNGAPPKLGHSFQVDMNSVNMAPAGHEYREPGFFTRFLNRMFSNYRKTDCEIYKERQKFAANSEKRSKGMDKELADLKDAEKRAAEKAEKTKLKTAYEMLEREGAYKQKGKDFYKDLVAPTPVPHPEHMKGGKAGTNFYTQEEFNTLDKIDNKVENYKIKDQTVSMDEYCGLVIACSHDEKYVDEGFKKDAAYDDTLKPSLMNCGYTEKQAQKIIVGAYSTMISDDIMKGDLRENQGVHLEDTINPARKQAFELLEQYKQGNKAPLAEKIAEGITAAASVTDEYVHVPHNGGLNHFEFTAATADMLERDPELKKLAMDKGLKQEDIDAVKCMREYSKLDGKRNDAKTAIAKAAAEGTELSYQDKLKYTKDILTANIIDTKFLGENSERQIKGRPINRELQKLQDEARKEGLMFPTEKLDEFRKNPGTRPMPEKGKLYEDQITAMMNGRKAEYNKHPESLFEINDPEDMKDCRAIAEDLINTKGLADMSEKDLNKALNSPGTMFSGVKLTEMANASAEKIMEQRRREELGINEPEAENNPELDKSFDLGKKGPAAGGFTA